MAEYVTCPKCGSKVLTAETLLGRQVRCFGCDSRFLATPDPPAPEVPPPRPPPPDRAESRPDLRRTFRDEDDDDDWPFCPGCGRQVSWDDSSCPLCGEEFEEEDVRPARQPRIDVALPVRRDGEPHRGTFLFQIGALSAILGALSACTFGFLAAASVPLGVAAWVMASRDLRRMADGSVDPRGRNLTRHARSAGMAGVAFGVLFAGVYFLFWAAR